MNNLLSIGKIEDAGNLVMGGGVDAYWVNHPDMESINKRISDADKIHSDIYTADQNEFINEFGFRSKEHGTEFEHPPGCGQSERGSPRLSECPHELDVGHGIRRGEVDGAMDVVAVDDEVERTQEIVVMNPGCVLLAGPVVSTQTQPHETEQCAEDGCFRAHEERCAEQHQAGFGDLCSCRGPLP